jgi:thioredoxin 1
MPVLVKTPNFVSNRVFMEATEKQSFGDLIKGNKPVLVDFSAEWCGPCKMMPPILKEVKDKMGEKVTILKMDIDRNPAVASAYGIQSVPTMIVFRDGQIKFRQSGVMRAEQIRSVLDGILQQG